MLFFLATAALNASNFGFQVLLSRVLGPQSYSALLALLALLVIAGVPLSALQLSCAAAQARLVPRLPTLALLSTRRVGRWSARASP